MKGRSVVLLVIQRSLGTPAARVFAFPSDIQLSSVCSV
jgi:hypothetical protein